MQIIYCVSRSWLQAFDLCPGAGVDQSSY